MRREYGILKDLISFAADGFIDCGSPGLEGGQVFARLTVQGNPPMMRTMAFRARRPAVAVANTAAR
jgi:hypothetical protein